MEKTPEIKKAAPETPQPKEENLHELSTEVLKDTSISKIEEEIRKLEKVETVRDLQTLDVDTLIALEDKFEGILLYAFTDALNETEKIDFQNWKTYKEPTQATTLKINFRGNSEAEMKIGAGDIFPPSVSQITVFPSGDKSQARTSEKRIGEKGRNTDGTGFFDSDGYIPIFSGDLVEIGKIETFAEKRATIAQQEATNLSPKTQEQTPKQEPPPTPNISPKTQEQTPKQESPSTLNILAGPMGKRVIDSALKRIESMEKNRSCWTVCEQIYTRAGAKRKEIYHYPPYEGPDCGNCHAGPREIDKIEAGDWLFINSKGRNPKTGIPYDKHGNHSIIFVRWLDKKNLIAEVISGGSKTHPRLHKANLKKSPVTSISKPIPV